MKYLKINLIITITFLIGSFNANAQTSNNDKARIAEIKKWYGEIQTIGLKNCKTKNYVKNDGLTKEQKVPFDQKIQVCQLNNLYQVTKCQFRGYEWDQDVIIYRKNSKVFFVFITGGSEGYVYERRYYCNQDETLIQQLERDGGGGELKANNVENKTDLYKNIKAVLADTFNEIERVLK
ncbi:MAG: hypothetical protein NT127_06245 [Sphingobacteriales bacterium]|nr:hypothetical protein [Sphingobacteriales bacterium]